MLLAQGFLTRNDGEYVVDFENKDNWKMEIPTELIPVCPHCGKPMHHQRLMTGQFVLTQM